MTKSANLASVHRRVFRMLGTVLLAHNCGHLNVLVRMVVFFLYLGHV